MKLPQLKMLRSAMRRITDEPFIASTGLAAFVHSTWSLTLLFSGEPPAFEIEPLQWLLYVLPAAFIAFAIDVGQIATSAEIRRGQRNKAKFFAFAVLAVATYYLQWLYLAHHIPALQLGAGVPGNAMQTVESVRDAAVWFLPALLPLATVLYTFSHGERGKPMQRHATKSIRKQANSPRGKAKPRKQMRHNGNKVDGNLRELPDGDWVAECPHCEFKSKIHPTEGQASFALRAHWRGCKTLKAMQPNGA